ncbi:Ig-like domain-containing protein [Archangium lipolyticum]|uniref:Ig-like domain-containing protein n=1 Tax=Archangium lipolyticum TaxID=2970465 RepID=UPI002149F37C|nr:Ig-like domain-containing protein [Archangium lipolyticum]
MIRRLFLMFGLTVLAGCAEETPETPIEPPMGTAHSALTATYNSTLRVPWCGSISSSCSSGSLLNGRGSIGPERNAPNTINGSCIDGNAGTYTTSESLESLSVGTLDGTPMATNKPVQIIAEFYVSSAYWDSLDLYYATNANSPTWTYLTTLYGSRTGYQSVSTIYTLPEGSLQAIRGRFSYRSSDPSPCSGGSSSYTDHDDLVFAVSSAPSDTTPPSVSLTSPVAGATVPQAISMTANATDDMGVARVEFFGDGVWVGTDATAPYSFVWNTSPGPHTLYAKAYDTAENVSTSASVSIQSNIAPSVWFISPEPNAFFVDTFHVVAGASDDAAVTQVQFLVGGVVRATDTTAPYEADLSTNGVHTVTARAFDAVGNTSDANITIRNDTAAPQVAITHPVSSQLVSKTVNITVNAIDDVETQRVEFFADEVPLGTDSTAPYSLTWDTRPLQSGPHARTVKLRARVYDLAGRFADSALSVSVLNDNTPPTVSLTAPVEGQVVAESVAISATAFDDMKLQSVQFSVDGSAIALDSFAPYGASWNSRSIANGVHTLTATATDSQGNTATHSIQIVVDNDVSPPVVEISAPAAGSLVEGTVTVTANASDNRAVTKVEFLLNGKPLGTDTTEPWSIAWNTRSSGSNGPMSLSARAHDAAGNVTTSALTNVTVDNDWSAPVLSLTAPAANAIVSGTIQVTATATDNRAVTRVEFFVNSVPILTQTSGPYGFAWDTTLFEEGTKLLEARAYDAAGYIAWASVVVTVRNDSTPPEVSLTGPAAGASLSGIVSLSATATDNFRVSRVEFLVDGVVVGSDTSSPYSINWNSASVANGTHSVMARAWDARLSSTTPGVSVEVSNSGPVGEASTMR